MFNDIYTILLLPTDIKSKMGMKERIFNVLYGSVCSVSSTGKQKRNILEPEILASSLVF